MMIMQVVMALLLKQETIERPHRCHCLCEDCQTQANNDELKFARSRLNAYRALASEAYLATSLTCPTSPRHLSDPARLTCLCRLTTQYWRRSVCVTNCFKSQTKRNTTRLVTDTLVAQTIACDCVFAAQCLCRRAVSVCPYCCSPRSLLYQNE